MYHRKTLTELDDIGWFGAYCDSARWSDIYILPLSMMYISHSVSMCLTMRVAPQRAQMVGERSSFFVRYKWVTRVCLILMWFIIVVDSYLLFTWGVDGEDPRTYCSFYFIEFGISFVPFIIP